MKLVVCIFAVILGFCQAAVTPAPKECISDADCTADECCYKQHEFLVVSKKRQVPVPDPPKDPAHTKGVCQSYINEGELCGMFDKANGFCSCNDRKGLTCQFSTTDPTQSPLRIPGLGTYRCTKAPFVVSKK
ncbi:uncharacterized protein LOC123562669 [Mercenaria mercenaria]|uniref:uncharacterized protein LOC123562669 n=1 Tax=Mercenaria mercenaria TaxID=6596 RepID=UPI00234F385B|nr:uncharacterized protein LOC123562669 [Mercenaria mercenaria]